MSRQDDPLLAACKRESLVVAGLFVVVVGYVIGVNGSFSYGRTLAETRFILGFPDWVFYGVLIPWLGCYLFSIWFANMFMQDGDLGPDVESGEGCES